MSEKIALVTGSTSGIGLGIAYRMAEAGYQVVLNGLSEAAEAEELRADIEAKHGVKVIYVKADLSKAEACRALVKEAEERLGPVDVLINNAGIQYTADIQDFPDARWDLVIAINQSAVFHLTKAVIPGMLERNWGRVINIASAHGLVGSATKSAYVSAKHAVVGLTKVVALETATSHVTVNAICPGWVKTPMVEKQIADQAEAKGISIAQSEAELLGNKQPAMRFSTPEQLGGLAVFLSSDDADTITGTAISMDGGWTAH